MGLILVILASQEAAYRKPRLPYSRRNSKTQVAWGSAQVLNQRKLRRLRHCRDGFGNPFVHLLLGAGARDLADSLAAPEKHERRHCGDAEGGRELSVICSINLQDFERAS